MIFNFFTEILINLKFGETDKSISFKAKFIIQTKPVKLIPCVTNQIF